MFDKCYELNSLDLSNFDSSNASNMSSMFSDCNNLKELNLLKFSLIGDTSDMFLIKQKEKCNVIANDKNLLKLYKSS